MPESNIHKALIALGANLGDCRGTLLRALEHLDANVDVRLTRQGDWFESTPVGGPADQPRFVNSAATLETRLSPQELRQALLAVENELGRVRDSTWGPRNVDLDLLLYDDQIVESPSLTVPHPRMAVRSFVLEPAAQVAGDWRHPWLDATVQELWVAWQKGDEAIALLGSERFVTKVQLLVDNARIERCKVGGRDISILCLSDSENPNHQPRFGLAESQMAAISGFPTLVVDLARPEIAIRDICAAIADAWPHLGPQGDGA